MAVLLGLGGFWGWQEKSDAWVVYVVGRKNRVQKSDAGVGIGTLVGDRDYLARKSINWFDLPHVRFMFF